MASVRNPNPNEAITRLALPEGRIPVLLRCSPEKREGLVCFSPYNEALSVRAVPRETLQLFVDPKRRAVFEKEYGSVPELARAELLAALGMAGAIARSKAKDEGWRRALRDTVYRWAEAYENADPDSHIAYFAQLWERIRLSPMRALDEELNAGVRKSRFVFWWVERERRLVPGLLCEDVSTVLYALALMSELALCLRCGNPYFRARRAQKYCGYKCQTAAGMARYRQRHPRRKAKKSRKTSTRKRRR